MLFLTSTSASTDDSDSDSDSDSELSTVSSSRSLSLEEDWWKEKALEAARTLTVATLGVATATVTVMRTHFKDKQVH